MPEPTELAARLFGWTGGELVMGGVPVSRVVERFGTPLFVYDRGVMLRSLAGLRAALPPRFDVHYSIKANPNQAILRLFLGQGLGLEVASAGELYQALAAGCAPERILFAGPGKTRAELDFALSSGIGEIHLESLAEADELQRLAETRDATIGVSVRVNPGDEAQGGAMRMGGKPAVFGVDEEQLEPVLEAVASHSRLRFCGIHLFAGTQILDPRVLVRQYAQGLEIAKRAARKIGRPLATVDFGGGLGIPYYRGETALDLDGLALGLAPLFAREAGGPELEGTRFIVEPGRFLVGESGLYLTRVTSVKISRGRRFVVLDGGMHHHLAASGNLGQVIKRNFPVALVSRLGEAASGSYEVAGPLCTPLDVLARDVALPDPAPGDLFGVFQSGAYARAASPLGFLSHPGPAEVEVGDGEMREIRRRGELGGPLHDQPGHGSPLR